jgi:hypothetical protein
LDFFNFIRMDETGSPKTILPHCLEFLESVPDVSAKLKAPITADRKFEDVVKSAQDAAVLVLVY